jgi:hypothetical protein
MMANAGISGWRLEKDSKWFSLVSLSYDSETDETGINSELLVSDKNEDN